MRVPHDLSGADLIRRLERLGYVITRQNDSYVRLTINENGEHHVTVPNHAPLRLGTLSSILAVVASHHGMNRNELLGRLLD